MYLYVKAFHVFAVVLLIGGILLMALAISSARPVIDERTNRFIGTVLRWDSLVIVCANLRKPQSQARALILLFHD